MGLAFPETIIYFQLIEAVAIIVNIYIYILYGFDFLNPWSTGSLTLRTAAKLFAAFLATCDGQWTSNLRSLGRDQDHGHRRLGWDSSVFYILCQNPNINKRFGDHVSPMYGLEFPMIWAMVFKVVCTKKEHIYLQNTYVCVCVFWQYF